MTVDSVTALTKPFAPLNRDMYYHYSEKTETALILKDFKLTPISQDAKPPARNPHYPRKMKKMMTHSAVISEPHLVEEMERRATEGNISYRQMIEDAMWAYFFPGKRRLENNLDTKKMRKACPFCDSDTLIEYASLYECISCKQQFTSPVWQEKIKETKWNETNEPVHQMTRIEISENITHYIDLVEERRA